MKYQNIKNIALSGKMANVEVELSSSSEADDVGVITSKIKKTMKLEGGN